MTRLGRQVAPPLIVAVLLALRPAFARRQSATFRPLLADPHEPGFFAADLEGRIEGGAELLGLDTTDEHPRT